MIRLDGSTGEGGGQILRSALSLSLATGLPFEIEKIRANRNKGGLLRQHLTCVKAALAVAGGEEAGARAVGAELGSSTLQFSPARVTAGDYRFSIGSAGSTTLVLQTVLVPLLFADGESTVRIEGGTHNSAAPPFDFAQRVFVPLLARLGARVELRLERAGFHPAGGGALFARISPLTSALASLSLLDRGAVRGVKPTVVLANLSPSIGHREASIVGELLGLDRRDVPVVSVQSDGPGNLVSIEIDSEHAREIVTSFGERGVRAEDVAKAAATEAKRYIDAGVPVGEHLADQLLLPLALGGGGTFRTGAASEHLRTNAWIVNRFLGDGAVTIDGETSGRVLVSVRAR